MVWPTITYIIPIIVQHTPEDYYLGYPIALIFHGVMIQITLPFRLYPKLIIIFMTINTLLILTFPEFLMTFDDRPDLMSPLTATKFYFLNGITFWFAINLILGFLLRSLNNRIEQIDLQKNLLAIQKEELEEAMHTLHKRQEQLIHSEKMASLVRLSSGLAHEINNPLNYIIGSRDLLNRYLVQAQLESKDEINDITDMLTMGVDRIHAVVHNLGLLMTNGEYSESFHLHEIVDSHVSGILNEIPESLKIINSVDEKLILNGNPVLISQVFVQVLSNAVDASFNRGNILIETIFGAHHLQIQITDQGMGIKTEDLPFITDPFFTTKEPGKGTGLGLFIASSIIKELNGELKVESQMGIGTKVLISLPLSMVTEKP